MSETKKAGAAEMPPAPDQVEVKKEVSVLPKGINVVATMPGYYNNDRKKIGDKFTIDSKEHLGIWMKQI